MNEYTVYVRVIGRCSVVVEADNLDEAKSIAENKVGEYDFGNLEDIDRDAVAVEDDEVITPCR